MSNILSIIHDCFGWYWYSSDYIYRHHFYCFSKMLQKVECFISIHSFYMSPHNSKMDKWHVGKFVHQFKQIKIILKSGILNHPSFYFQLNMKLPVITRTCILYTFCIWPHKVSTIRRDSTAIYKPVREDATYVTPPPSGRYVAYPAYVEKKGTILRTILNDLYHLF